MPSRDDICAEISEGQLPADTVLADGTVVHSLTAHALCAMDRHKWIESQKYGHDVGEYCFEEWIERYWRGFARARLLEHLYGWRCWSAFSANDFGLLNRTTVEHFVPPAVVERAVAILGEGGENLDVITWALESGQELDPILWLLDRIDINAKRQRLLADHIRLFVERI